MIIIYYYKWFEANFTIIFYILIEFLRRIFGLSNNFVYSVMLSAANDIIKMKSTSNNNSVEVPTNRQQSFSTNVSFNHSSDKCVVSLRSTQNTA